MESSAPTPAVAGLTPADVRCCDPGPPEKHAVHGLAGVKNDVRLVPGNWLPCASTARVGSRLWSVSDDHVTWPLRVGPPRCDSDHKQTAAENPPRPTLHDNARQGCFEGLFWRDRSTALFLLTTHLQTLVTSHSPLHHTLHHWEKKPYSQITDHRASTFDQCEARKRAEVGALFSLPTSEGDGDNQRLFMPASIRHRRRSCV